MQFLHIYICFNFLLLLDWIECHGRIIWKKSIVIHPINTLHQTEEKSGYFPQNNKSISFLVVIFSPRWISRVKINAFISNSTSCIINGEKCS